MPTRNTRAGAAFTCALLTDLTAGLIDRHVCRWAGKHVSLTDMFGFDCRFH